MRDYCDDDGVHMPAPASTCPAGEFWYALFREAWTVELRDVTLPKGFQVRALLFWCADRAYGVYEPPAWRQGEFLATPEVVRIGRERKEGGR